MLAIARSPNVTLMYVLYVAYGVIYHTIITIARFVYLCLHTYFGKSKILFLCSGEVAKNISQDSYGLIFGMNTFVALFSQTVLTKVVTNPTLGLKIRSQASKKKAKTTRLHQIMTLKPFPLFTVHNLRHLPHTFRIIIHFNCYTYNRI